MKKTALITGITGQDGSYLAEYLLSLGYSVHGTVRRVALENQEHRLWRIKHIKDELHLHSAELESYPSIWRTVNLVQPDEVYHLAAQSYVSDSFDDEFTTMAVNIDGTHNVLSAVRDCCPGARFYFAASSEMFGNAIETPQRESTPFHPRSPYAISKVAGFHLTRNYREAHGMHASSGILFNHESPRRGMEFVTRKITHQAARIKLGLASSLVLGNLDAKRDWGHAKDYVRAMHAMLQQPAPGDYVVATGETHTVREFVNRTFAQLGLEPGKYVRSDGSLLRPAEVDLLHGDATRARRVLGWNPEYSLDDLIAEMVQSDLCEANGSATSTDSRYWKSHQYIPCVDE